MRFDKVNNKKEYKVQNSTTNDGFLIQQIVTRKL